MGDVLPARLFFFACTKPSGIFSVFYYKKQKICAISMVLSDYFCGIIFALRLDSLGRYDIIFYIKNCRGKMGLKIIFNPILPVADRRPLWKFMEFRN